jgi:cell division protein FtsL
MSVAAPVLEKSASTKEQKSETLDVPFRRSMTEDERHNAQISSRYKMLINPDCTLDDIMEREGVSTKPAEEVVSQPVMRAATAEAERVKTPYLVSNARADAEIFRADSVVNRVFAPQPIIDDFSSLEELDEEDEDLRPTMTTIQYKTMEKDEVEEQTKAKTHSLPKLSFSTRDKIVIAVVVSVIVALFALIIVNSAIISSLNADVSYLQSSLNSAKAEYDSVNESVNEYMENFPEIISEYAASRGMVLMK